MVLQSRGSGRGTDRLTDTQVRAFLKSSRQGTAPTKKLTDGSGLYLMLTPAGTAVWRIKYRHAGRERVWSAGVHPEVSLAEARKQRAGVRALLRDGVDPNAERRVGRTIVLAADTTFAGIANAWLEQRKPGWSAIHYRQSKRALERDVFPALGKLPVQRITTPMIARVVRAVMARGANETASKVLWNIGAVFDFAQTFDGVGLTGNPATAARQVLVNYRQYTPRPALLDFPSLGDVLRRAELAALSPSVRMAHRLVAFTVARIGTVVSAKWEEFDLDAGAPTWTIPRARMKVSRGRHFDHVVMLGPTIAGELRAWSGATGGVGYVFRPSYGAKATITREALEKVYRKTLQLSGTHSVHGWRASLATLAKDEGFSRDVVELALDHVHDNEVVRAYDRGERRDERVKLAHWWDANLTSAQRGSDPRVLPIGAPRTRAHA